MDVFIKSQATYRTLGRAVAINSALILDSLEYETGSVTVAGTDIGRKNTGDWLIAEGRVYQIVGVKPQGDRTLLTVAPPLDAFSRPMEYAGQQTSSVGQFAADLLQTNWALQSDPAYALPYLVVSNSDTTAFVPPETDKNGLFKLPDYLRLMRRTHNITVEFQDSMGALLCSIRTIPVQSVQVLFTDGHSMLKSVDYAASAVSKLTVRQIVDPQAEVPAYTATTWYLAQDGTISQQIPAHRAEGKWDTITISARDEPEEKARQAFARNKSSHKLEFYSDRDLRVGDNCRFQVYGEIMESYLSYKQKSNADTRWLYRSGELAVTAAEKLRGARS